VGQLARVPMYDIATDPALLALALASAALPSINGVN
jgi:hypothetical protein